MEYLFIENRSFYSKSKVNPWNATSTFGNYFGVILIGFSGVMLTLSTDLEKERYPQEFLFICGFA